MSTQSRKCPNCNLVNFASDVTCKRCNQPLIQPAASNTPANSTFEDTQGKATPERTNLFPCPDCGHSCSNLARTCPGCGRVLQTVYQEGTSLVLKVAVAGVIVFIALTAFYFYSGFKREVEVTAAVQAGNAKKAGVSSKNKESAKVALNAIGEIQSVTSVGTNFSQYTSTLQSAKIKYDSVMRDFSPQDPAEEQILNQLRDSLKCYLDAKDAWQEFVEDGDQYGFLSGGNTVVSRMASTYGYSTGGSGDYYRSTVIQTIWEKAAHSFESASEAIK